MKYFPIRRLTTTFPLLLILTICHPQYDCENFPAFSLSYVVPKTIAVGIDYFTEIGITAGAGAAYTVAKTYQIKQGANTYDSVGNMVDVFAYVGYRIARIDYVMSLFVNAGYTMGDRYKAQPFVSTKLLLPINTSALSFEPGYIFGRGATGKLSIHLKL